MTGVRVQGRGTQVLSRREPGGQERKGFRRPALSLYLEGVLPTLLRGRRWRPPVFVAQDLGAGPAFGELLEFVLLPTEMLLA